MELRLDLLWVSCSVGNPVANAARCLKGSGGLCHGIDNLFLLDTFKSLTIITSKFCVIIKVLALQYVDIILPLYFHLLAVPCIDRCRLSPVMFVAILTVYSRRSAASRMF